MAPSSTSSAPTESTSSFETVFVGALEHDDEVGESGGADRLGDAEVETDVGGDGRHGDHVDVLEDEGADPVGDDPGTAAVTSSSVVNGASTVVAWARRGCSFRVASVTRASVPSDTHDELGQVVARRGLHELPAGADHVPAGEHRLEPEHVMTRHPVLDGPHTAGVGGDVAPSDAVLAGVHRVDEPVLGGGAV